MGLVYYCLKTLSFPESRAQSVQWCWNKLGHMLCPLTMSYHKRLAHSQVQKGVNGTLFLTVWTSILLHSAFQMKSNKGSCVKNEKERLRWKIKLLANHCELWNQTRVINILTVKCVIQICARTFSLNNRDPVSMHELTSQSARCPCQSTIQSEETKLEHRWQWAKPASRT